MSPWLMSLLLLVGWGAFFVRLRGRWLLLTARLEQEPFRLTALGVRLGRLLVEGFGQRKLHNYPLAGLAHHCLFLGFLVLLLRTLTLWGRGYWPDFQLRGFAPSSSDPFCLGNLYLGLREYFTLLVLAAVAYFAHLRSIRRERRLTLSREGLLILLLIATMMVGDLAYEACGARLAERSSEQPLALSGTALLPLARDFIAPFVATAGRLPSWLVPGSAATAWALSACPNDGLLILGLVGYGAHVLGVLTFLYLLPGTKHFHVITALPNLFLASTTPPGVPASLASSSDELLERVDRAMQEERLDDARIGYAQIEHFPWKARLDWFSCTECGRCTEHCPASRTGKRLDPKQLTLALRRELLAAAPRLLDPRGSAATTSDETRKSVAIAPIALVPNVVAPEVFWACTTCRACEEQCPVGIGYLDTVVGFRRNAVLMQGEAPPELHRVFDGLERQGNPWNFPRQDRDAWASELEVPRLKETARVDVLYWVGCAASYDERAKAVARAFIRLMQRAKIRFAILGDEEQCTGDAARRAGNELLFLQLAQRNIERLNGYQQQGRFAAVVTTCPHCQVTLKHDYRDFGGNYDVLSHIEALERWVREGRLPRPPQLAARVAYHDPCNLARNLNVIDAPRHLLKASLGAHLVEPEHHGKHTLCCGAGGAQMWLEEQNQDRMNVRRGSELLATGADHLVSACPFCLSMLSEGAKKDTKSPCSSAPRVMDLAEWMEQALQKDELGQSDEPMGSSFSRRGPL